MAKVYAAIAAMRQKEIDDAEAAARARMVHSAKVERRGRGRRR